MGMGTAAAGDSRGVMNTHDLREEKLARYLRKRFVCRANILGDFSDKNSVDISDKKSVDTDDTSFGRRYFGRYFLMPAPQFAEKRSVRVVGFCFVSREEHGLAARGL